MLDIRIFREEPDKAREALVKRGFSSYDGEIVDIIIERDTQWRSQIQELESLKKLRNELSLKVGENKKRGVSAEDLIKEVQIVKQKINDIEESTKDLELDLRDWIQRVPNLPHLTVPTGKDENDNVTIRIVGNVKLFEFSPKPHEMLGENLNILDFQRAAKVTGSRFSFYKGLGSKLERAISNFMLDVHTNNGYLEFTPPVIVNRDSLVGTGQLPKFEEDLYKISDEDKEYYLIPTAEVPVTNYHRNEILKFEELPLNYTALTPCFRSEAGSAGRDTKGIIRQHQFNKVELVKMVLPENSYQELENITKDAERILQLLELPYRVVTLCTGDMGFGSAKTYDIEVWFPSQKKYREISSASNFEDFQARRAGIRFRRTKDAKPEFLHTLNASGLAVGRCFAAIIENYQQEDGSIIIPEVLRPYMGGISVIKSIE